MRKIDAGRKSYGTFGKQKQTNSKRRWKARERKTTWKLIDRVRRACIPAGSKTATGRTDGQIEHRYESQLRQMDTGIGSPKDTVLKDTDDLDQILSTFQTHVTIFQVAQAY